MSTPVTSATWFDGTPKTGKYVLTQDITIDSDVFVDLSGNNAEFDGQDYVISIAGGITDFHGLFKLTDGPTVKNVTVEVARVDGKTDSTLWGDDDLYLGGAWLVRDESSGNVLRCTCDGDANAVWSGSIVGTCFRGIVYGCEVTGNVRASYAGGVVGGNLAMTVDGVGYLGRDTTVSHCVMRGSILAIDGTVTECGGIAGAYAGDANGTFALRIERCAMLGATIGNTHATSHGGIVGPYAFGGEYEPDISASFVVTNCYNVATIGSESAGIMGPYAAASLAYAGTCTISNCYNAGAVIGLYAAGILGLDAYANVTRCFNLGDIEVVSAYSAGIVCSALTSKEDTNSIVSSCYNAGNILGEDCGGLVAYQRNSLNILVDISNCYSSGTLAPGAGGLSNYWNDEAPAYSSVFVTGGKLFFTKDASGNWLPAIDASANLLAIQSIVPSGWDPDVWAAVPGTYPVLKAFTQSPWTGYAVYTDAPMFGIVRLYAMTHAITQAYESVRLLGQNAQLFAVYEQSRKPGLQGCRAAEVSLRSSAARTERTIVEMSAIGKTASLKVWAAMRGRM